MVIEGEVRGLKVGGRVVVRKAVSMFLGRKRREVMAEHEREGKVSKCG